VLPTVTLLLHSSGGEARGLRFPPANPLPRIKMRRGMTLTLVARGGGRVLGVIFFWLRVMLFVQELQSCCFSC
jgi:hypothetical protein